MDIYQTMLNLVIMEVFNGYRNNLQRILDDENVNINVTDRKKYSDDKIFTIEQYVFWSLTNGIGGAPYNPFSSDPLYIVLKKKAEENKNYTSYRNTNVSINTENAKVNSNGVIGPFELKNNNAVAVTATLNGVNTTIYTDENCTQVLKKYNVYNGNIYIKSNKNEKIEVIDDNSGLEMVDEHYKKLSKQELEKYKFDFDKIVDKNVKKRYSSILNPVTLLINGFRKVFDFSILKKILLIGFFISAMFIMYAVSSICATLTIKDADFVQCNSNYLKIKQPNMSVEQYRLLEQNENVNYILPGSSIISFEFNPNDYYQSSRMNIYITGSISSTDMINSENLISGTMPENDRQLVLDKMVIQKQIEQDISLFKMMGILKPEDMIGRTFKLNNVGEFTVVGIVDLLTPSIYASPAMLINIVQNARNSDDNIMDIGTSFVYNDNEETDITQILDYKLFDDKITLEKGRFPENDYEVIVNISHKYDMKLNKTIPVTVNDTKLTVVGYYDSQENIDTYLVNNNTVKYKLIGERKEFMIYTKDKDKVLSDFRSLDLNIIDTYENSKKDFLRQKRESMKTSLIVSAIILAISLVEIFLMIRSSFLSRIKEIGILRAIGIKKMDIYKMFAGETIAITTLASIPGILLMVYILKTLSQMAYFSNFFLVNTWSIIATIIFIYAFNLIVGLLPVHNVVKKTPAQILSRYDI